MDYRYQLSTATHLISAWLSHYTKKRRVESMSILFQEEKKIFTIHTANSTYQMKVSEHGHLLHLYYGSRIPDGDVSYLIPKVIRSHESNPAEAGEDRVYSLCSYPQEFSSNDAGDYRIPSIELVNGDGSYAFVGKYHSHKMYPGKYGLSSLPTLYAEEGEAVQTLEIVLEDEVTHTKVKLLYGVFYEKDIITRAVVFCNESEGDVQLERLMSANVDFMTGDFDLIGFFGHHYLERQMDRRHLSHGINELGSFRGVSGHFHNPFAILCDRSTDEDHGNAYGFALMYSGNFVLDAEVDGYSQTRVAMGIHPKQFRFLIKKGECFEAPEVVMTYSHKGLSGLSHSYHDIFRKNACRSKFVNGERPVILNSWEPFGFKFDKEKLIESARISKELGADMFVLDDGWFGARDNDRAGLGDWVVNEKKLPGGIPALSEEIHSMGMKFGLWFEPEMVNEDSDLYRAHPEWCLRVPGRAPSRSRHQLCLDLSRPDVCDYLIRAVNKILDEGGVDYVKWDYNRYVCDVYSSYYPPEQQGEIYHRYILGLYRILDGIIKTHPDILFEGCSGGGGRFDAAMLTYFPQIWCSDNTDAPSRLIIQYGTSFAYPVSTMGAHVSVCPNKRTKRTVSFKTRAVTAMHGTFGYELDPGKMSEEERKECAQYSAFYKKHQKLIMSGDYYRLSSPYDDSIFTAWQFVSKDREESLVCAVTEDISIIDKNGYIHLRGLKEDALYRVEQTGQVLSGAALAEIGLLIPHLEPQYSAFVFYLKMEKGGREHFVNYAHRGASQYAPENTFLSFDTGMYMGANGIETDVQMTKDGILVLFHDDSITRLTGESGSISDYTLEELQKFTFEKNGLQDKIVVFEDFLKRYGWRDITFAIEIKQRGIEPQIADMIRKYHIGEKSVVTSFKLDCIQKIKEYAPELHIGWLKKDFTEEDLEMLKGIGAKEVCPHAAIVTRENVAKWHQEGFNVRAWGVDNEDLMKNAYDCMTDGMTVNFPDKLADYMKVAAR